MKFILEVRMIEERDLRRTTPFLPEDEEYERDLSALREDLSHIDAISEVRRDASTFQIVTTSSMLPEDLGVLIKPVFTPEIMKSLRFVCLIEDGVHSLEK
jgi:hypothetical protein